MTDSKEKIIKKHLKQNSASAIKGKKSSITTKKQTLKIQSIWIYKKSRTKSVAQGLEFLCFKFKSESSKRSQFFFGKILARCSSDIISMIAKEVIKRYKPKSDNKCCHSIIDSSKLMLAQYPVHKNDVTKQLVILYKIPAENVKFTENDVRNIEDEFLVIHNEIRERIKKIVRNSFD